MKYFLRSNARLGSLVLVVVGLVGVPLAARGQARNVAQIMDEPTPLLLLAASQGYLGVDLADVDQEKAQALKLKEVRGAIVTLIDHDAPAGQIGMKVNDVVLKLNGQPVEGAEQLRRMLREIPAGRQVSLVISRDGNVQTLAVQLADRRAMEHEIWNKIGSSSELFPPDTGMGILAGGGGLGDVPAGTFHMPFLGSSLNVGALVEPLTSQMAGYLGVPSGLMVKQVARKSEAATAGFKAFDVILKVGSDNIKTLADWDRSLRSNQGKPVQVTILRDRKQQVLTLLVASKHHGELMMEEFFPAGGEMLVAELDSQAVEEMSRAFAEKGAALAQQAKVLEGQIGQMHIEISPEQAAAMRMQADKLRESLKGEKFQFDANQLEGVKQQMEEFRKNFKAEEFKLDSKQMDELCRQMEQLKRQMEELKGADHLF